LINHLYLAKMELEWKLKNCSDSIAFVPYVLPKPFFYLEVWESCAIAVKERDFFGSSSANILFIIYLSFPWTAFDGWCIGVVQYMFCIWRKRGTGLIFSARGHFPSLYRLIWSFCKSKSLDTHYIVCPVIF